MLSFVENIRLIHYKVTSSTSNASFFSYIGYPLLAYHWPTILFWALFFEFVVYAGIYTLKIFSPKKYGSMGYIETMGWTTHLASQMHASVAVYLSLYFLFGNREQIDKYTGFDERVTILTNFSGGLSLILGIPSRYFVWDLFISIVHIKHIGIGFVMHALIALNSTLFTYKPALQYFQPAIMMFELSTLFLNNVWFCDQFGYSGSSFQILNGVLLAITFFFARVVLGTVTFIELDKGLIGRVDILGKFVVYSTLIGSVILWTLNAFWMYKIVITFIEKLKSSSSDNLKEE
ncbi:hypothetical protein BB560_000617 [Smittium megazygosporum]|uniref:TLC domain-containing protein n=1 Tax=Smittium megazygosporum TaxID=133381 RepID=A0A2T9ZJU5_9FUNG|nr:hypothetical protein BB560_000617 [Smittium megazygosporum]